MKKRWPWPARITVALFAVPIAAFFNVILVCAVGSALWLGFEATGGRQTSGVITDAASHTVNSNKGADEHYCFGRFTADDDSVVHRRVNVFTNDHCFRSRGMRATLVHGLASPLTSGFADQDTSGPMPFNGLFGMTDGAVIDWRNFVTQLWPMLFLLPIAVGIDVALIQSLRSRFGGGSHRPR